MNPGWLEAARTVPLPAVAGALGLRVHRRSLACPACGLDRRGDGDPRGPADVYPGSRWRCYRCEAGGSGIDLVAHAVVGARLGAGDPRWTRVREWFSERGWCDAAAAAAAPAPLDAGEMPDLRARPPVDQVRALLLASPRIDDGANRFPEVGEFLRRRHLEAGRLGGVARVLPAPRAHRWPWWWPESWASSYRLVVPAWEADGTLAALHGRAVDGASPKTRWPRGGDGEFSYRRLLFACPRALALMRGRGGARRVLVCEGITDFLATVQAVVGGGERFLGTAVMGGTAGSFPALADVAWPADVRVFAATDPDRQGRVYAQQIADAMAPRPVRPVPLWLVPRGDEA